MKVLQTIGHHSGTQHEGIFRYRRIPNGVEIDLSVGTATTPPNLKFVVTNDEWKDILDAFASSSAGAMRLRSVHPNTTNPVGPTTSVQDIIKPFLTGRSSDSHLAAVCAVLEHEGSIDHYGSAAGPIILTSDVV